MVRKVILWICICAAPHLFSADGLLQFVGDYQGRWVEVPEKHYLQKNEPVVAQVFDIGKNRFRLRVLPDFDQRCEPYVTLDADGDPSKMQINFENDDRQILVTEKGLSGTVSFNNRDVGLQLEKVVRLSPSFDLKPPEGAEVLFDGSGFEHWEPNHSKVETIAWVLEEDQAMRIPQKSAEERKQRINHTLRTKKGYRDSQLHLEFRCPWEPQKEGQGKGNSGVFLQGVYEVQILNSYGQQGYYNQCGALYKVSAPKVNMAAPSYQWQTYDIEFYGPRFDASGVKVKHGRITVRHNGVLVHKDFEIPHLTSHKIAHRDRPEPTSRAPLVLQDHNNSVEFRNIWIVDLEK